MAQSLAPALLWHSAAVALRIPASLPGGSLKPSENASEGIGIFQMAKARFPAMDHYPVLSAPFPVLCPTCSRR